MKRILATTAIVALMAGPAFAQSDTTDQTDTPMTDSADMSNDQSGVNTNADVSMDVNGMTVSASDLIGKPIYIRNADAPDSGIVDTIAAPSNDWENVGEINDVVLSQDGRIEAITLDVGGFLGMGGKQLSTSMDELKMVAEEGSDGEYFVVFTGDRSALEEREELDRQSLREEGRRFFAENNQAEPAENELGNEGMASDNLAADPNADSEQSAPTLTGEERTALTAKDLQGVAIYDASDEHVGDISDIVLTDDGQVSEVIIDVGGFLGLGAKPVAISFDDLELIRNEDGVTNSLQARTSISAEELKNMEAWNG